MRHLVIVLLAAIISTECTGQDFNIKYKPVPSESGFRMDGYWVWCGSVIKVDSTYHLFASRWKKTAMFPENYRNDSEIVRATSPDPLGPYKFQEVVIGERDSSFWDSNMAHNPAICKIGNEYVIYYIGSDFTTRLPGTRNLLRRVGFAVASDITGPWHRSDRPVIKVESNNPSVLVKNGKISLI